MAKVVQLILATKRLGSGTNEDPFRSGYQLFTFDGRLVADVDPEDGEGGYFYHKAFDDPNV